MEDVFETFHSKKNALKYPNRYVFVHILRYMTYFRNIILNCNFKR